MEGTMEEIEVPVKEMRWAWKEISSGEVANWLE